MTVVKRQKRILNAEWIIISWTKKNLKNSVMIWKRLRKNSFCKNEGSNKSIDYPFSTWPDFCSFFRNCYVGRDKTSLQCLEVPGTELFTGDSRLSFGALDKKTMLPDDTELIKHGYSRIEKYEQYS